MPLRGIGKSTDVEVFARALQDHPRHSTYFKSIPESQLCALLRKVKDACAEDETHLVETGAYTSNDELLLQIQKVPPEMEKQAESTQDLPPVSADTHGVASIKDLQLLVQCSFNKTELSSHSPKLIAASDKDDKTVTESANQTDALPTELVDYSDEEVAEDGKSLSFDMSDSIHNEERQSGGEIDTWKDPPNTLSQLLENIVTGMIM
jgi:hypothetical protein